MGATLSVGFRKTFLNIEALALEIGKARAWIGPLEVMHEPVFRWLKARRT